MCVTQNFPFFLTIWWKCIYSSFSPMIPSCWPFRKQFSLLPTSFKHCCGFLWQLQQANPIWMLKWASDYCYKIQNVSFAYIKNTFKLLVRIRFQDWKKERLVVHLASFSTEWLTARGETRLWPLLGWSGGQGCKAAITSDHIMTKLRSS